MEYILTGGQMKMLDSRTIEEIGIPSMVLMERAALACVTVMKEEGINLSQSLIVCGSGNNGGDGFAIARILAEQGYTPEVLFVGNMESGSRETMTQMEILKRRGMSVGNSLPSGEYSVIIDAVFGIGLGRELEGKYKDIVQWMNRLQAKKVAVDIPSGVSSDTGMIQGVAFKADLTVTFAYRKIGQILYPGASFCGKTVVVPIGITDTGLEAAGEVCFTMSHSDARRLLPKRPEDSNKGTFGKLLMIVGSKGMSGAAFLSATAAYRCGAGLVRIFTEESNRVILQQLLPEAVIITYSDDREHMVSSLLELIAWADVLCVGGGLGTGDAARELIGRVLETNTKPCVLDADGLNLIAESEQYKSLLKATKATYIITPHMKEMSRLSRETVSKLQDKRLEQLRRFTREYPVVCVLKDARTTVLQRGKQLYLNTTGCAAMAKAGAGDVLAGIIAGFVVQGVDGFDGAVLGVYLHGMAGQLAAVTKGNYSVLARDIIEEIGTSIQALEEQHENIQQSARSH